MLRMRVSRSMFASQCQLMTTFLADNPEAVQSTAGTCWYLDACMGQLLRSRKVKFCLAQTWPSYNMHTLCAGAWDAASVANAAVDT